LLNIEAISVGWQPTAQVILSLEILTLVTAYGVVSEQTELVLFEENSAGGFIINHPHVSTYYLENSAATPLTLYKMLTNRLCNISNLTVHNALSSDHRSVVFELTVMALSLLVGNLFPVIVGQIGSDVGTS
jgi:hypothetical protein